MNYARAIRIARAARGMSQKQLAMRANLKPSYVSLLESGKRDNPTMKTIEALARALDVPIDVLLLFGAEESDLNGLRQPEATVLAEAMVQLLGGTVKK